MPIPHSYTDYINNNCLMRKLEIKFYSFDHIFGVWIGWLENWLGLKNIGGALGESVEGEKLLTSWWLSVFSADGSCCVMSPFGTCPIICDQMFILF